MSEVTWAEDIRNKLDAALSAQQGSERMKVFSKRKLPYRYEIFDYRDTKPNRAELTSYETDLLVIAHRPDGTWLPRVVIEGKLNITTHDALTYNAKAATHKQVHPYLRYGILVGALAKIPARLFRHGAYFDFMVTWQERDATDHEWANLVRVVQEEIQASRQIEVLIRSPKASLKEHFSIIHRKLVLDK